MRMRTLVRGGAVVAIAAGLTLAAPAAFADHTHVRVLGNGQCVVISPDGGEKYVELPRAALENHAGASLPANRTHPLHVLVHLGEPGQHGEIYVLGSADAVANCAGYVNRAVPE
jgi:hypothetical protein